MPPLKTEPIGAKFSYTKTCVHHLGMIGMDILNRTPIIRLRQALGVAWYLILGSNLPLWVS
jgi:hypothetical protein